MTKTESANQDKPDMERKASTIELSNQDKIDIAKMFIQSGSDWLMFFSERRWMVLKNSVGAMLAVASASLFNSNILAFISLVIGIAVSATVYLVKNHSYDKLINSLKDRIHEALLCYEKDVYFDGDSLFPDSHKKRDSRVANYTFIAVIWIVAMTSIFAIMVKKEEPNNAIHPTASVATAPSASGDGKRYISK